MVAPINRAWGERLAYLEDPEGNAVRLTEKIGGSDEAEPSLAADARKASRR